MEKKCLFLSYFFLSALAVGVYNTKYTVLGYEKKLKVLRADIYHTSQEKHLLTGEWSVLTHPDRLEKLSHRYLLLQPAKGDSLFPVSFRQDQQPGAPSDSPISLSPHTSATPLHWVWTHLHERRTR